MRKDIEEEFAKKRFSKCQGNNTALLPFSQRQRKEEKDLIK